MKRIVLFSFAAISFINAVSQTANVDWAIRTGGPALYDFTGVRSVATDAAANVYTAGTFTLTGDFDPGPGVFNLTSTGYGDGYIAKHSSNGSLIWVKQLKGTNVMFMNSVKMDAAGNVYAAGYFDGRVDFDPGPDSLILEVVTPELSFYDAFVAKFNSNGELLWAKQYGRAFEFDMETDASGNTYVTGLFSETTDFDPGIGVFELESASPYYSSYILKLDPNGNFVWAVNPGTSALLSSYSIRSNSITIDGAGNVYCTGSATADINSNSSSFIVKFNNDGSSAWEKLLTPGAVGWGIAVDGLNNVITVGDFSDVTDFDPGPGVYTPDPSGTTGVYTSKLDANGNFVWTKLYYGSFTSSTEKIADVKTDAAGNIYAGFTFFDKIGTNPGPSGNEQYSPAGYANITLVKFLPNGDNSWTKNFGDCGYELLREVTLDNTGNIYLAGWGDNFDQIALPFDSSHAIVKLSQSSLPPSTKLNLSGRIWEDLNKNGIDNNEPPVSDFRVILYKDANNDNLPDDCFFASVQTDHTGNYSFPNIDAGNYIVAVALPATGNYMISPVYGGDPDNNIDKDNNGLVYFEYPEAPNYEPEMRGQSITLTAGEEPDVNTNVTYDMGLIKGTLTLGNRVWDDINTDGKDNNEPGLANVSVNLYRVPQNNNSNNPQVFVTSTTTDENGYYSFSSLLPGKYVVKVETPEGYQSTIPNGGDPDNNKDKDDNGLFSSANQTWGLAITLSENREPGGNINNTYDFGFKVIACGNNQKNAAPQILEKAVVVTSVKSVFPNPFKNEIRITLDVQATCMASVKLISTTGSVVYNNSHYFTAGINSFNLTNLQNISNGVYVLQINTRDQLITQKVIKQ